MTFGKPNTKMDTSLKGDDALWAEADYYMSNRDDHAMLFNREFFRKIVPFLYNKALTLRRTTVDKPLIIDMSDMRRQMTQITALSAIAGTLAGIILVGSLYQIKITRERSVVAGLLACDPKPSESVTMSRDSAGRLTCEKRQMRQYLLMPAPRQSAAYQEQ